MRILLTGAAGKLANAIRRVGQNEHQFVLLDCDERIAEQGGMVVDMLDAGAVHRAAEGCDAIIHTAAMHGGWYGKAPHEQFIRVNTLGAEHLFAAAVAHGIRRLVMSSTMEVVIGRDWSAWGPAVVDETTPPRPDWIYPVTKLQVEMLGSFYANHYGLEVVHLRYMAIHDASLEQIAFGLLARHVSAEDCARANLLAATRPGLRDQVFHIGPDTPLTQRDVNEARENIWPVLERYWPGVTDFCRQRNLQPTEKQKPWPVTRIDKARLCLGWQPHHTFDQYLRALGWRPTHAN